MSRIGRELAGRGWLLRSGGSPGADCAFERGCDRAHGRKEIYLPWPAFNGSDSPLFESPDEALRIALRIHPCLNRRTWQVKKLRARNACQILGTSLSDPSDLVIAWTENGLPSGGSATVMRIAVERGISVINLVEPLYSGVAEKTALKRLMESAEQIEAARKSRILGT